MLSEIGSMFIEILKKELKGRDCQSARDPRTSCCPGISDPLGPDIKEPWIPARFLNPIKGYRRPDVLSNDSLTILQKIQQFQYVQHTTKDAAYYLAKSLWLGSPNAEVSQPDFVRN